MVSCHLNGFLFVFGMVNLLKSIPSETEYNSCAGG